MKRTKLSERTLPAYTKGEEIFNMVSHIVGGVAGIATIVLCCIFGAIKYISWSKSKTKIKKSLSNIRPLCNIRINCRLIYTICTMYIKRIFNCTRLDNIWNNMGICNIRNNLKFN